MNKQTKVGRRTAPPPRKRLFLSALIVLAGFTALELGARCWLFGRRGLNFSYVNSLRSFGRADLLRASPAPEVHYELRPNLNLRFQGVHFQTNAWGMRNPPASLDKPGDCFRLAIVGDSPAMGWGVQVHDSFPALLQEDLNDSDTGTRFEVLNFAVAGYGLWNYLATARHKALPFNPDLLLVTFTLEDLQIPTRSEHRKRTYVKKSKSYPGWHSFLWKLLNGMGKHRQIADYHEQLNRSSLPSEQLQSLEELCREFARFAEDHHVPVVFVCLKLDEPRPPFLQQWQELMEQSGFLFLDTASEFPEASFADFFLHPLDRHPNEEAHRRYARSILQGLLQAQWLP
ncbi:MAG: hypothetical protein DWQ01_12045 [Planctomycetota bacterium]|nr:MAG: hypothetical protein DWQ01_12045 [Planctomycetota bacterium]